MAKPKATTLVFVILLVATSVAAVNFGIGRNSERARRVWVEGQLEKLTAAKETLEQERDELVKAKETLEAQLTEASTTAKQMAEEMAAEKRARETLTAEMSTLKKNAEASAKLEKEKAALNDELAKAKQSYQALSNELTTLRQAKEALERRVKEMLAAQAQEAERIVVKPAPMVGKPAEPPPVAKAVDGKVLVVNREFNFVVMNLGSKDGIKNGLPVSIVRGDKPIAKAQVERVYDNMAAATLMAEEQKGQVREGDLVRVGQ